MICKANSSIFAIFIKFHIFKNLAKPKFLNLPYTKRLFAYFATKNAIH